MRLQALGLSVFRHAGSEARCRMRSGRIRACSVRLLLGRRLLAHGSARSGAGVRSLGVGLELTPFGRRLLARRLGGARARLLASGLTSGGARRASAHTRALLQVEHFTTPAGSWLPDQAALSPRGERFLRGLRGKLIAVAALRCDGYTAKVSLTGTHAVGISRARAAVMCAALRRLGVRAPASVAGHGDSEPLAPNTSESGQAQNRRVEVTLTHRVREL
jgi:hypothetical protein